MAGFDDEVSDYFVEDAHGFGEGVLIIAEGVQEGFDWMELVDFGKEREKVKVRSASKLSWPLWRAARARGSVMVLGVCAMEGLSK